MKKLIFPVLLMASTLAISCSNSTAPKKYGFYTLKKGVDVASLQGSPWLNTSIIGMANKINRPSAKDDFFAYSNYDTLISNKIPEGEAKGGGTIYSVLDMMDNRIDEVKNNSKTFKALKDMVTVGAVSQAKIDAEKYFNMTMQEFKEYASSVEFFRGSSALLSMTNTRDLPVIGYAISENSNLATVVVLSYMFGMDDKVVGMLADIAEYQGFDRDYILEKATKVIDSLAGYAFGVVNAATTVTKVKVSELSTVFNGTMNVTKIVKDLGLQDDDEIGYSGAAEFVNSAIEQLIVDDEKFDSLRTILGLSKIFENRYLIGAENIKELYVNKLVDTGAKDKNITEDLSVDQVAEYVTNFVFGLVIDKEYSATYITSTARERVEQLIKDVVSGFTTVLQNSDWLSDVTKQKAVEKMEAMRFEAFYSDAYEEKEAFTYTSSDLLNCYDEYFDYFMDGVIDNAFFTDALHTLPVTTVNAAYNPNNNSFRIFHGIVSGFIDKDNLSREELYGKIGTVIGHEITHGFDSTGAYYDKEGQIVDWWTEDDKAAFEAKIKNMADYYENEITVISDTPIEGDRLTGEAIADMGGLKAILEIAKNINNFDYDKFFRSNATFYDFSYTEDGVRDAIAVDPHPIGYLRINLTYAQFDKFLETYNIKPGDGMYIAPADRIAIW